MLTPMEMTGDARNLETSSGTGGVTYIGTKVIEQKDTGPFFSKSPEKFFQGKKYLPIRATVAYEGTLGYRPLNLSPDALLKSPTWPDIWDHSDVPIHGTRISGDKNWIGVWEWNEYSPEQTNQYIRARGLIECSDDLTDDELVKFCRKLCGEFTEKD